MHGEHSACDTETYATADKYDGKYIMRESCDSGASEEHCN